MNADRSEGRLLREAYPLTWPDRQGRTAHRRESKFKVGLVHAREDLVKELALLGAREVIVSTNVKVRRDGLPLSNEREPTDPGVAVYFERFTIKGGAVSFVIACDSYNRIAANLRAVGVTVGALRAIQRHGASEMLERAFTGFAALPEHTSMPASWWDVLGVPRDASNEYVRDSYRKLAGAHHPDAGGDTARMAEINVAFASFQRERE